MSTRFEFTVLGDLGGGTNDAAIYTSDGDYSCSLTGDGKLRLKLVNGKDRDLRPVTCVQQNNVLRVITRELTA